MNKTFKYKLLILIGLLLAAFYYGLVNGSSKLTLSQLLLTENSHIFSLRLSRVIMSAISGMGLAVSGLALQAILRNPLAEPYLLGTSSGAGLGSVLAVVLGVSSIYLPLASFIGALLTIILVYNLARQSNKVGVQSLILSGVIASIAISGVIVFLISVSGNEALHGALWWLWGSMQIYDLWLLTVVSAVVILGIFAIYILAQDLNAISIGEEEAMHLGINTEKLKKTIFFITSLITAALVCACGIIGFVGLVIPHMMRFVVGPNHKVLIPTACLAAATFMIISDTLSRTLFSPIEVPIGVITAVIGAPLFIILLKRRTRVS